MGVGGIVTLAALGVIAFRRANFWLVKDEVAVAVWTGILFAVEVAVLVLGNLWVWLAWVLLGAAKSLWLPSEEMKRSVAAMPQGAHEFNVAMTVLVNGLLYSLFQWLR